MKLKTLLMLLAACLLAPLCARAQHFTVTYPYGTITDSSTSSLGASSTQVLAAVPNGGIRTTLFVQLNTANASLACNPNGTAALNTAGSITISGQGSSINFASLGAIPNTALSCIADAGGRSITVWSYPQ